MFKKGDYVEVIGNCKDYVITTPGSRGVIVNGIIGHEWRVSFNYYSNKTRHPLQEWIINECYLKLVEMDWDS